MKSIDHFTVHPGISRIHYVGCSNCLWICNVNEYLKYTMLFTIWTYIATDHSCVHCISVAVPERFPVLVNIMPYNSLYILTILCIVFGVSILLLSLACTALQHLKPLRLVHQHLHNRCLFKQVVSWLMPIIKKHLLLFSYVLFWKLFQQNRLIPTCTAAPLAPAFSTSAPS